MCTLLIETRDVIVVNLISRFQCTANVSVHIKGDDGINRRYFDQVVMPGSAALLTAATQRTVSPGVNGKILAVSVSIAPEPASLSPGANGESASLFAEVYLSTGRYIPFGPQMMLMSGAVFGARGLSLGDVNESSIVPISVDYSVPAAGEPLVLTPWLHENVMFHAMRISVTTDANIATRRLFYVIRNYITGTEKLQVVSNETQLAASTVVYHLARNIEQLNPAVTGVVQVRLPDVRATPYEQVRVGMLNMQAGDAITQATGVMDAIYSRVG